MKRLMKSVLVLVCVLSLVLTAVACNGKKNENANNESTNKNPLQLATLHAMLELAGYTEGVEALENYFVNGETVAMLPSVNGDGNNDKVNDGNNGNGNDKKVTVEDAYVDENGDLNVELSNGNSVNAGGLSDEHKEIIVLRDMQDMSYEEIAKRLDISEGTVKSRLSRARQALKRRLEGKNIL